MRRVTGIFGGDPKPPAGGNPDSNTLISDMTTVRIRLCLGWSGGLVGFSWVVRPPVGQGGGLVGCGSFPRVVRPPTRWSPTRWTPHPGARRGPPMTRLWLVYDPPMARL